MSSPKEYVKGDSVIAEFYKDLECIGPGKILTGKNTLESEYLKLRTFDFYRHLAQKNNIKMFIFDEGLLFKKSKEVRCSVLDGSHQKRISALSNHFKESTKYPLNNPLYFYEKDCWNVEKEKDVPLSFWGKFGQKFILNFSSKNEYWDNFLSLNKTYFAKNGEPQGTVSTVLNDLEALVKKSDWSTKDDLCEHFGPRNLKLLQEVVNQVNLGYFFLVFAKDKNNSIGDCFRLVFVLEKIAQGINGQKRVIDGEDLYIHQKIFKGITSIFDEKLRYKQEDKSLNEDVVAKVAWSLILAKEICSPKKEGLAELNFWLNFSNGFKPNMLAAVNELRNGKNNIFALSDDNFKLRFDDCLMNQKLNLLNFINCLGENASIDFKTSLKKELDVAFNFKNNENLDEDFAKAAVKSKVQIITIKNNSLPWANDEMMEKMFDFVDKFYEPDYDRKNSRLYQNECADICVAIVRSLNKELIKTLSRGLSFKDMGDEYQIKDGDMDIVVLNEMAKPVLVDMIVTLMSNIYNEEREDRFNNSVGDVKKSIRNKVRQAGLSEFVKAYDLKNDLLKNMEDVNSLLAGKEVGITPDDEDMDGFVLKI